MFVPSIYDEKSQKELEKLCKVRGISLTRTEKNKQSWKRVQYLKSFLELYDNNKNITMPMYVPLHLEYDRNLSCQYSRPELPFYGLSEKFLFGNIFKYLDYHSVLSIGRTCKMFYKTAMKRATKLFTLEIQMRNRRIRFAQDKQKIITTGKGITPLCISYWKKESYNIGNSRLAIIHMLDIIKKYGNLESRSVFFERTELLFKSVERAFDERVNRLNYLLRDQIAEANLIPGGFYPHTGMFLLHVDGIGFGTEYRTKKLSRYNLKAIENYVYLNKPFIWTKLLQMVHRSGLLIYHTAVPESFPKGEEPERKRIKLENGQ